MYNIIVNPIAGNNRASKVIKKVVKYLKSQNVEFLVYFSENAEHITNTTKTLCRDGEKDFIVIGGDGTLNHFINGLIDPSKVKFGIIPSGKHNHFAKYLSIPTNPIKALQNIFEHPAVKIDYLKCNEYRALNLISMGALEVAENKFLSQDKNEKLSRKAMLRHTLKSFDGLKLYIETDSVKHKERLYTSCAICNGGFYGDNIYISPLSNMHDGLANLITLDYTSAEDVNTHYSIAKQGKHIYKNPNSNLWIDSAVIKSQQPFDAMLDGEIYQFDEMEINVIPNGLNIYTKK